MYQNATSTGNSAGVRRFRRHGFALRLTECFLSVALATAVVRSATLAHHLIWIANGVLLAYLLLEPRRRWAAYLITAFAAQTVGCILVCPRWQAQMLLTVLNLVEALISAYLLRRRARVFLRFTNLAYLLRFIAFAVLAGPLAIGVIYALIAFLWAHTAPETGLLQGVVADGLGVAITTPACVAIFRTRFSNILASKANWLYVLLLVALTPVVFAQSSAPVAFILYPLLLLILLRIGMGWAAMATLFVATVSGWFTFRGQGPFALSVSLSPIAPSIILQLYIMAAIFMLYSASVVLESQEATERQLRRIVSLHALITANSRDAIILADLKGNRRYVSSASQTLGGWTPNDLIRQGSFDLIHPEDRPRAEATAKGLTSAGDSASMEIRVRKRSGDYIWMESSLRVARDPETGTPYGILNMMRDISERKQAEQQLEEAYHAVEALAITDALTGLANRRRFDSCLTNEWRRGMRDRTPLSLLLIDVDLFKSYNDSYGHLRGDSCLKQVAESAQDVVMRPGDLVARFGGEEFAVILPGTCNEGATRIANNICEALHDRKVAHKENPFGIVTISVGCATMTPQLGHNSATLIELADEALYRSKRNGRNQVSSSQDINCTENESTGGVLSGAVAHKPA